MRSPNAVNEMIEKVEGKNGTVIQELPANPPEANEAKPFTPQQRADAFIMALEVLKAQYGVVIIPYIKIYNNGVQVASIEYAATESK